MHVYIIRRLLQVIPVVLVTSFLVFMLLHMIPGDPAQMLAGPNATDDVVEALRSQMNLDRSVPVQYGTWLANLVRGDMGRSLISNLPVSQLIGRALGATLQLASAVLILAVLISIPLGVAGAAFNGRGPDHVINGYVGISLALPNFWLGILLILVFAVQLRWLPSSGYANLFRDPLRAIPLLILPTIALGNRITAEITRFVKNSMLETFKEDFVRTARAKGVPYRSILFKHVLRNALIPVVTMIGLRFGRLLGGAVVVETVFAWPGIGRLIVQSIGNRDYPLVQGSLMVVVLLFITINLVTDILYGVIDPRISIGGEENAA